MEIKKNNMEVRKNWNKFTFKKLGAIFCLFLFGVVTFISGNLSQVNAASSSTVLPVAKGGTGQNNLADVNVGSATKLQNARNINGESFNGTNDINISASYKRVFLESQKNNYLYFTCSDFSSNEHVIDIVASSSPNGGVFAKLSEKGGGVSYAAAPRTDRMFYYSADGGIYFKVPNVVGSRSAFYLTTCSDPNAINLVTDSTTYSKLEKLTFVSFSYI
ncbi:MAG: hypothetical protein LBT99_00360 [Bifidobacteriaceae bacterium]|jgi:hypothetical protein|nr:hypothetical protein [Bifidobacteriaceae bacterium]